MFKTINKILLQSLLLVAFSLPTLVHAQCDDDTQAPSVACINGLSFTFNPGETVTIWAQDIDAGSNDNCTEQVNLDFRLELSENTGSTPPETTSLVFSTAGEIAVSMWVGDENGLWSTCFTFLTINEALCPDDTEAPVSNCFDTELPLSTQEDAAIHAAVLGAFATDNCDEELNYTLNLASLSTGEPQAGMEDITFTTQGVYAVEVWSIDNQGNSSSCISNITVSPDPGMNCDNDTTAPTPICNSVLQAYAHPIDGVTIWALDIDEGSYDFCSAITLELTVEGDFPGVIQNGESVTFPPAVESYTAVLTATDESDNSNTCWATINIVGISTSISGQIYVDDNNNCELDGAEADSGFEGWKIRATDLDDGRTLEVFTSENGHYSMDFISVTTNNIQLEVILPNGISSPCPSSLLFSNAPGGVIEHNFAVTSIADCTYLSIDVSTPFLRRCFVNTYHINYSNYSSFDVEDGNITLVLDPFMEMVGASLSYTNLGNGQYLFDLGTIPATSGNSFTVDVNISCDANLAQTHCMEARIFPFTCVDDLNYAELKVEGECNEALDEVQFKVTNIGQTATTEARPFIIVEDVVMYMQENTIDLPAGESMEFVYPANGATWRCEVEQDPNFPFGGTAASFVEGCGGFTPNIATLFSLSSTKPNVAHDCQENIGSWDPNDKQAFPRGYAEEHYIKANTPIEYLIRFQNTGTDTAFNIVVEDQLSEWLDPSTLRPGASSHPYRLVQKEDGDIAFHFDNIMLPDSFVNELGSNGFVKFYIDQIADLPLETRIENTAHIFFDFNEAVITNTVFHTIGEQFITVGSQEVFVDDMSISIRPNPLQTTGQLILHDFDCKKGQLQVFDLAGRLVQTQLFSGHEIELNRSQFTAEGIYFFNILEENEVIARGKLMVQ